MANGDFSRILNRMGAGEKASPRLMEELYTEMRAIAGHLMQAERATHTLQPTALVHEAFLRLVGSEKLGEQGQLHFLDAAAVTMRRVLVDHARAARAQKRGGGRQRESITLSKVGMEEEDDDQIDVLALHAALEELGELDRRQARIVELRFFGGMTGKQIADRIGVSRETVVRELALSRAWLRVRMEEHRA